jgi:hypothetical protein
MKQLLWCAIILIFLLPSCSNRSSGGTTVVKPKTYNRFFDRKKDKRKPRTKKVKMKG